MKYFLACLLMTFSMNLHAECDDSEVTETRMAIAASVSQPWGFHFQLKEGLTLSWNTARIVFQISQLREKALRCQSDELVAEYNDMVIKLGNRPVRLGSNNSWGNSTTTRIPPDVSRGLLIEEE